MAYKRNPMRSERMTGLSKKLMALPWVLGLIVIVTPEADKVIAEAKKYGINAQVAGQVTEQKGITLESKGIHQEKLLF